MGISEVMNAQMGNQTQVNYANHDSVPNVGPSDGADADEAKICDAYHRGCPTNKNLHFNSTVH